MKTREEPINHEEEPERHGEWSLIVSIRPGSWPWRTCHGIRPTRSRVPFWTDHQQMEAGVNRVARRVCHVDKDASGVGSQADHGGRSRKGDPHITVAAGVGDVDTAPYVPGEDHLINADV